MKDSVKRTITSIAILAIVVLIVTFGMIYRGQRQRATRCSGLDICVVDSAENGFVTQEVVRELLDSMGMRDIQGMPIERLKLNRIENYVKRDDWVADCQVFSTIDGMLHIKIRQKKPLLRVMTDQGDNYYLDSTLTILPISARFSADVPLVSGYPEAPAVDKALILNQKKYGNDVRYLKNLINFARVMHGDEFLRSLAGQIFVNQQQEIEIIPRVGAQIIRFGTLDEEPQERLQKLKAFYRNGTSSLWLTNAREVDVRYKNQVIVK